MHTPSCRKNMAKPKKKKKKVAAPKPSKKTYGR